MFGGVAAVYFAFGLVVGSMAPLVSTIRADLGISRSAMGLALSAWAFIYIFSAPPAGRMVDRLGLRWSITVGTVILFASALLRAGAQGIGTLWLAIALFGVGGPLISVGAPKVMGVWFGDPDERRFAIGAYTAAPALGGFTALSTTNPVLVPWLGGWRQALLFHSGVMAVALVIWWVIAARAPDSPNPEMGLPSKMLDSWKHLLGSSGVRLAMALGIGIFVVNHSLSSWLPNILEEDGGFSKSAASGWVAASVLVSVAAALGIPRLATPERRVKVMVTVFAVMALGIVLVAISPGTLGPVGVLVLAVRASAVPLIIVVLMEADRVTAQNSGEANGLWFSFVEIGGVAGPLIAGALGDSSLGFQASLLLFAAICVALVALSWFQRGLLAHEAVPAQ